MMGIFLKSGRTWNYWKQFQKRIAGLDRILYILNMVCLHVQKCICHFLLLLLDDATYFCLITYIAKIKKKMVRKICMAVYVLNSIIWLTCISFCLNKEKKNFCMTIKQILNCMKFNFQVCLIKKKYEIISQRSKTWTLATWISSPHF